ncbi:MAG: ShlB/FhaC/HecB family hemolysin secretion/activation protein [Pseudomonadota bacterium]
MDAARQQIQQPGAAGSGAAASDRLRQFESAIDRRRATQQGQRLPEVSTTDSTTGGEVAGSSTVSFQLNGITYPDFPPREFSEENGNFDQITDIYESFIGKDITIGGLREIANRIEQLYRESGFLATRVIIPPQSIDGGIAELQVHEGRIVHYEVNGDIGPVKKQIAALLDNLITNKAARRTDIERYLLLARDLPGISLTGTLRSAGDSLPGGVILVVDTARKPVDGFIQLQNRNAQSTGAVTLSAGAAANSNTEYAERIGAIGLAALEVPEQFSGFASAEMSVGNDGMVVRMNATYGLAEPGDALEPLDLNLDSFSVEAEAEYPLVRSRRISVWSRGGFEFSDLRASVGDKPDDDELFDDQLRVLYAGLRGIWFAPLGGRAEFDLEFRRGIDYFGASDGPKFARSRTDGRAEFLLARGDVSYAQPIWPFFELYGKVGFQISDGPLLSYEEMVLGELTFGRGFEPGAITGDEGFAVTGEIRFFPPGIDLPWLDRLELYGFYDFGRLYDDGDPTGQNFEELMSAGFGARFQLLEMLYGDIYFASPQTDALSTVGERPDGTVKFTLTQFF